MLERAAVHDLITYPNVVHQHLVEPQRAEGTLDDVRDGLGSDYWEYGECLSGM